MSLLFQSGDGDKLLDMVKKSQYPPYESNVRLATAVCEFIATSINISLTKFSLLVTLSLDTCEHSGAVDLSWNFQDE